MEILGWREIQKATMLSDDTIKRLIDRDGFPSPTHKTKVGKSRVYVWDANSVAEWMNSHATLLAITPRKRITILKGDTNT